MTGFLPVGYQPLKDAAAAVGIDRLGSALAGGVRRAFVLDPWGKLRPLDAEFWRGRDAAEAMEMGTLPKKPRNGSRPYQYGGCQILVKSLQPHSGTKTANAMLAKIADSQKKATIEPRAPATNKNTGGRLTEYDWEEILIEIARINHFEGLPKTQAEIVRRIQLWYAKNHDGIEPGESVLKTRVSRFFKAIRSET